MPDKLTTVSREMTLVVAFDGDETVAQAISRNEFGEDVIAATGRARRRKGDPRNHQVGIALAVSRVFRELAEREESFATEVLENVNP